MTQLTFKIQPQAYKLFEKTFGMWTDMDIDVKDMRKEIYERRIKK